MQVHGSVYVKPTGVTYKMRDARVRIIPNEIIFGNDTITDPQGHIGIVTGGLHHKNLSHLTFDINILARNLLAYNFPKKQGKDSFWGVVYGTGKCNIKGEPGSTTMNIDMEPEKNTYITYDASSTNDASTSNFIRWINVPKDSTGVLIPEAAEYSSVLRQNQLQEGIGYRQIQRHTERPTHQLPRTFKSESYAWRLT